MNLKKNNSNTLNLNQKKAVAHKAGSLLVIAGAGSGKTRIITHRIINFLTTHFIPPSAIIALTFTNKAAREMKERIVKEIGENKKLPFIGTFHAYSLYLLKLEGYRIDIPTCSIIDDVDKKTLINQLLKQSILSKQYTARTIGYKFSLIKNNATTWNDEPQAHELHKIYQAYESEKKKSHSLDFDDLLHKAVALFETDYAKEHHNQVRHILIDEYQDTNQVQHDLLQKMSLQKEKFAIDSICAVGDEDQSIYSWRGAIIDNMLSFNTIFKKTTLIRIEQNYRSKQPILSVAHQIIKHNKHRYEKKVWSDRAGKDCVRGITCISGYQEADIIAQWACAAQAKKDMTCAILYRTHVQSRPLEEACIKQSIAYTIIGGIKFYERKEIKDLLAYLKLIMNPFDKIACKRIINCPLRGLGEAFQDAFFSFWSKQPFLPFIKVTYAFCDTDYCPERKGTELKQFASWHANTPINNTHDALTYILKKSDYINFIKQQYEQQEAQERIDNIQELLNAAVHFGQQKKESVNAFLEEVMLLQEQTSINIENKSSVTLMTLHAAKGLEFNHVAITGLEENLLPSARSQSDPSQIEEERRLLYVGITRAKDSLFLSHAQYRQRFGNTEQMAPSRFWSEIDDQYCKKDDVRSWKPHEISDFFSQWFHFHPKKITPLPSSKINIPNSLTPFKKYQTVRHKQFGLGIVKNMERRDNTLFVTAHFNSGTKKIASTFLIPV